MDRSTAALIFMPALLEGGVWKGKAAPDFLGAHRAARARGIANVRHTISAVCCKADWSAIGLNRRVGSLASKIEVRVDVLRSFLLVGASRREVALGFSAFAAGCATHPLAGEATFCEHVVIATRDRPVRFRLARPAAPSRRLGYVVFSHGANSNGGLYDPVLSAIALAGFLVVAPTHVDAEINPERAKFDRQAVAFARQEDLQIAMHSALELIRGAGLSPRQVSLEAAAVAGHSYGALIALQAIGALWRNVDGALVSVRDPRFRCALAFSPPPPLPGFLSIEQFNSLGAPFMLTTGARDTLPNFAPDWRRRLAPLETAGSDPGFGVILADVDHYFGGLIGRHSAPGPAQRASLDLTLRFAALFLQAYARDDKAARAALLRAAGNPEGLPEGLEIRLRANRSAVSRAMR